MTLKVVDFPKKELLEHPSKSKMIQWLEELLAEVRENKVDSIACAYTYADEPGTSMCFRAGDQGLTLVGRLEYLKHRIIAETDG